MVANIILTVIFMIPLYALLIWTYCCPEESILFGKRWMYNDEPEISRTGIRYAKFSALTAMVGLPIVIIILFLDIPHLRLAIILFPIAFVIGAIRMFSEE
ncbi:hypothetical protein [Bacillus sp. PS06]|uniref:hypothetical protein n=1 Tax=Bacillus sp. PS06 TaxID=2764176 RepID=UPI001782F406|nr:hypothetical protein [Bacillus sp. PS06]MBD8069937.1 hypothetical protein [Bacillus sp. PS06]